MSTRRPKRGPLAAWAAVLLLSFPPLARAHPMVEDALDVVISPDRIVIDARISPEQILVAAGWPATQPAANGLGEWVQSHAAYLRKHLTVSVDGRKVIAASAVAIAPHAMDYSAGATTSASLVPYRLEYPLDKPPTVVKIDQNLLREFNAWSATCILRIRQVDDASFDTALLTRERTAEYDCVWPATTGATTKPSGGVAEKSRTDAAQLPKPQTQNRTGPEELIQKPIALVMGAVLVGSALFVFLLWRAERVRTRTGD